MNIKIAGKTLNKKGKIAVALLIGLTLMFSLKFVSAGPAEPQIPVSPGDGIVLDERLEAVNFLVEAGDSAWEIQQELTPGWDVSRLIHQLEQLNGIDMRDIEAGDVVQFAIEKKVN